MTVIQLSLGDFPLVPGGLVQSEVLPGDRERER